MPLANIETGTKVCCRSNCKHAGQPQPVTNFYQDKRNRDGLKGECADCHTQYARNEGDDLRVNELRKENRKQSSRNLAIARSTLLANAITRPQSVSHMNAVADALIRHAGSHDQLAQDYLRLLDDPDLKPQHKLKLYQGLFTVLNESDKQNPGRGDVTLMTDEELDDEMRRIVREELNKDAIEVEYVESNGTADDHTAACQS